MCLVCEKWMRVDVLQRRAKTHKDLLILPDEDIKMERQKRHEEKGETEKKRQKIVCIAKNLGVSTPANRTRSYCKYNQEMLFK